MEVERDLKNMSREPLLPDDKTLEKVAARFLDLVFLVVRCCSPP